jgi:uncharacterized MAPEG superfamily protein
MDPAAPLSSELTYVAWSVVLLILHIALQGGLATLELGLPYNASARDEGRSPRGLFAGRANRALRNFLETYPAFIALALALAITGKTGGLGATGAMLWFWGRLIYAPLYLFGVPYLRTLAWGVALVGIILMLIALLS